MTKVCTKCKEEKDASAFGKDKHAKQGLTPQCKECLRARRSKNGFEFSREVNGSNEIDLAGERFGKLTTIHKIGKFKNGGGNLWFCKCDCGNTTEVKTACLTNDQTKSCGCLQDSKGDKNPNYKHGMRYNPVYWAWCTMITRCESPNDKSYHNYGGRGIYVCDRWRENFENFYEDMGDKPSEKHTLDRIDHNGPYSPENCRWATYREQANNRRNTIWLTYEGETKPLSVWAEELGMPLHRLYTRKIRGHSDKEAITGERDGVIYPEKFYDDEEWKRVTFKEFSGFLQVSSHGRFYIEDRVSSGKRYKGRYTFGSITGAGYRLINLMVDGKTHARSAHQIVAAAFIDPDAPFKGMVVHHIDSNRENNHVNNLCFCSQSHNGLMRYRDN